MYIAIFPRKFCHGCYVALDLVMIVVIVLLLVLEALLLATMNTVATTAIMMSVVATIMMPSRLLALEVGCWRCQWRGFGT